MRIASSQYQTTLNRSLALNQGRITLLTAQMASTHKLDVPSDDPVTAVRLSRLQREEAGITQYRANIGSVKITLQKNETYLQSMIGDMQEGRDLLVWASDGGNASADLGAMVNSLSALRDSIAYSANVKDAEGRYIFSGTLSNTAAISYNATAAAGARYSYTGNNGEQKVTVGLGITQTANVDVEGIEKLLNQIDSSIAALQVPGVTANDPTLRGVLAANLDGVDAAMGLISTKIATFGGAQNILSTLDDNHAHVSLSNQMALTELGNVDYAVAATDLAGYTMALQSTYKAYAKVANLSLFDVL
jgi:flagellar hook-associated protein 3 FlgL